jgi:AraC-like DNA-binding protein
MTITNQLSIRSYTNEVSSHSHHYHQLVLPLNGSIDIKVDSYAGLVSLGDCVIIKAGQEHQFRAAQKARFLVADMLELPDNIINCATEKIAISAPLLAYIQFIAAQLEHQVNDALESSTFELFFQLVAQQSCLSRIDLRIERVIELITSDLSTSHTICELAAIACLSTTQYKKIFKQSLGQTTQSYISQCRMEKSKALLSHTDLPIHLVAETVGYINPSAFSRKFKAYFGCCPTQFLR